MDNRDILIDTSIIIEFLRKKNKQNTILWKIKEDGFNCNISSITVFELYAGAITLRHVTDLKKILKWMEIISLTKDIAEQSAEIYKKLKKKNQLIEFRDIFIGATSIVLNIPIITFNEGDFKRIEGIRIYKKNI